MPSEKPTILLIDDDTDLRETLADGLESVGYEVIQADNLRHLMDRLPGMKLSAMVIDLMLDGDSGATLLGYAKSHPRLKNIKCIMMSGYDHAEATARMWKADLFLHKPVTIARLIEALKTIGVAGVEAES